MPEWWRRGSRQNRLIAEAVPQCFLATGCASHFLVVLASCLGRRAVSNRRWGEVDWHADPIELSSNGLTADSILWDN